MIRWAVHEQIGLGLETVTDGEGLSREYVLLLSEAPGWRLVEDMVLQSFGTAGFAIECARVTGEVRNPRFNLAHHWKIARDAAPPGVVVKQTVTGPHVLTRFTSPSRSRAPSWLC
jgi:hypothetical protein